MRPSEFEAIRPYLQEAIDHIDRHLNRQREVENAAESWAALPEKKRPKAKLHKNTKKEQEEALRSFHCTSLIEHAYPGRHSSAQAAVWLRKSGWITAADAIDVALSELPTGPVNENNPDSMARQFDAIEAAADRVKTILTACLQEGAEAAPTPSAVDTIKSEGIGGTVAAKKPRKRTRKVDPKVADRRKKREAQWKIERAILSDWSRGEWTNYQDYVTWKNEQEDLPEGWPILTAHCVEMAIGRIKRRTRYKKK